MIFVPYLLCSLSQGCLPEAVEIKAMSKRNYTRPSATEILLIGGEATGKTAYIQRCYNGEFIETYSPSYFEQQTDITLRTNLGDVHLAIKDIPSRNDVGLSASQTNAAIVFIDNNREGSLTEAYRRVRELLRYNRQYQFIVVNNKSDLPTAVNRNTLVSFARSLNAPLFDVSTLTLQNFDHPLLHLAKILYNREDVQITNISA